MAPLVHLGPAGARPAAPKSLAGASRYSERRLDCLTTGADHFTQIETPFAFPPGVLDSPSEKHDYTGHRNKDDENR